MSKSLNRRKIGGSSWRGGRGIGSSRGCKPVSQVTGMPLPVPPGSKAIDSAKKGNYGDLCEDSQILAEDAT